MELSFWWILPLAAAAVALSAWLYRRRRAPGRRPIAHGERLTALPEYQRALRQYRTRLAMAVALGALFLAATAVAAARPTERTTVQPDIRNRDIVLCLDVSGSMTSTDAALAGVFEQLAKEFDGERIGMVMFDNSSVQLFPLTDDYHYAADQLSKAKEAFDSGAGSFFDGTWNGEGSSLIGDGLASCVQSFPDDSIAGEGPRSRTVVLATDNYLSGEPIFTLKEAAGLAAGKGVKVFALNPGDMDYGTGADQPGAQLRAAAEGTGGAYFTLDDPGAVPGIVQKVQDTQATSYRSAPQAVVADVPGIALGVAVLSGMGMMVLGWRLEP